MNEKLSVLEKSVTKPIEENISSNDDEDVECTVTRQNAFHIHLVFISDKQYRTAE